MSDESNIFRNLKYTEMEEEALRTLVAESEFIMTAHCGEQAFDWWRHPSGAVIVYPSQDGLFEIAERADKELS